MILYWPAPSGEDDGADCTIGPFAAVARDGIVPEGTTIAGNVSAVTALLDQAG